MCEIPSNVVLASQFAAFCRLCARHKFDLIHAHWVIPQGLVAVWGRRVLALLLGAPAHAQDAPVIEVPAPTVALSKLSPSYREMVARFWVDGGSALAARWAVNERIDAAQDVMDKLREAVAGGWQAVATANTCRKCSCCRSSVM